MKKTEVLMVRIYITESSKLLKGILTFLKNDAKIRGVSVFRAISGFGDTGNHQASLIDLALDLPLVIEFFDQEDKINQTLEQLTKTVKSQHIVTWKANAISS
jgi:hypothetical protein